MVDARLLLLTLFICLMWSSVVAQDQEDTNSAIKIDKGQQKESKSNLRHMYTKKHPYDLRILGTSIGSKSSRAAYFPDRHRTFIEKVQSESYVRYTTKPDYTEDNFLSVFRRYRKPKIRALLLGNQDYPESLSALSHTHEDVRLVKAMLMNVLDVSSRRIDIHLDLDKSQLAEQMEQFVGKNQNKKNELVIIYYSGYLSQENNLPLPIDRQPISEKQFIKWISGFEQDTLLIIDGVCEPATISSDVVKQRAGKTLDKQMESFLSLLDSRNNVIELKRLVNGVNNKEGRYLLDDDYKRVFEMVNPLMKQMNMSVSTGNGFFTLLMASVIADFGFYLRKEELAISGFFSLIVNKVDSLFEKGVIAKSPIRWPIFGSDFKNYQNEYLLFSKNLKQEAQTVYVPKTDDAESNTLYEEALKMKEEGKFDLAATLFLNLLNKETFRIDASNDLIESYLAIADMNKDDNLFSKLYRSARIYKGRYRLESSITIPLNKQIDILKEAVRLNNLGNQESIKRNYIRSIQYYQESLALKKQIQHHKSIYHTYNNMGVVYMQQNQDRKAITYFRRTLFEIQQNKLNLNKKSLLVKLKHVLFKNLSYSYARLNQMKQSNFYARQADTISVNLELN